MKIVCVSFTSASDLWILFGTINSKFFQFHKVFSYVITYYKIIAAQVRQITDGAERLTQRNQTIPILINHQPSASLFENIEKLDILPQSSGDFDPEAHPDLKKKLRIHPKSRAAGILGNLCIVIRTKIIS